VHSLGYPGNIGGANTLQLCASESYSPSSSCRGSGGPWIRDYRTGNHVNSEVHGYDSTSCTGTFGKTYTGARFTDANIGTLCSAQGC